MPKISSRKERGRLNDLLYGRGAKAIPPRMLLSKGDIDLSVEFSSVLSNVKNEYK